MTDGIATEAGIGQIIRHVRAPIGPYSANLRILQENRHASRRIYVFVRDRTHIRRRAVGQTQAAITERNLVQSLVAADGGHALVAHCCVFGFQRDIRAEYEADPRPLASAPRRRGWSTR